MGHMRRMILAAAVALVTIAASTRAEMAVEWWGDGTDMPHGGMSIELSKYGREGVVATKGPPRDIDGIHTLTFDLAAIRKGTRVHHASLRTQAPLTAIRTDNRVYMDIGRGVFYYDPLRIYAEMAQRKSIEIYVAREGSAAGKAVYDKDKPLLLEAPTFRSLDATAAVQDWVDGKAPNLGFVVRQLGNWDWNPAMTVLEVRYEGAVKNPPPQAKDVKVIHRKGQSFISWTEIEKIIDQEEIEWADFQRIFKKHSPRRNTLYRIYRHTEPITAANLAQAQRINEIWPLSGYDIRMHQHVTQGENWVGLDPKVVVRRYSIAAPPDGPLTPTGTSRLACWLAGEGHARAPQWDNQQLPLYTGLYVHQPANGGKAYYAVTALVDGVENTRDIVAGANATDKPLEEEVGPGEPTLYSVLDQSGGSGKARQYADTQMFVYWAAPPMSNLPRHAVHMVVTLRNGAAGKDMSVIYEGDGMYGSYLQSGANMVHWRRGDIQLIIVDDAAFAGPSYKSNWNTAIGDDKAKNEPYAQRIVEHFTPWVKSLKPRLAIPPGATTSPK